MSDRIERVHLQISAWLGVGAGDGDPWRPERAEVSQAFGLLLPELLTLNGPGTLSASGGNVSRTHRLHADGTLDRDHSDKAGDLGVAVPWWRAAGFSMRITLERGIGVRGKLDRFAVEAAADVFGDLPPDRFAVVEAPERADNPSVISIAYVATALPVPAVLSEHGRERIYPVSIDPATGAPRLGSIDPSTGRLEPARPYTDYADRAEGSAPRFPHGNRPARPGGNLADRRRRADAALAARGTAASLRRTTIVAGRGAR